MKLFITCPKGLEGLLAEELATLGISSVRQTVAGVSFNAELSDAYRICLWSRLANRVLLPLAEAEVGNADSLYQLVQSINWIEHMRSEGTLSIDFNGSTPEINNTRFGAQKVKDAIVDQIRGLTGQRPSVQKQDPDLRINVHLSKGKAVVALDLSGESLHRRNYRLKAGAAPLKENLAAAILMRLNWPKVIKERPTLLDPMCGSGTLLIEAMMMATDTAPGLHRKSFGFDRWLYHDKSLWASFLEEAKERHEEGVGFVKASALRMFGRDIDPRMINIAEENVLRAGFAGLIDFKTEALESLDVTPWSELSAGMMVTNPPYGERLGESQQLMFLYRYLADLLKRDFPNWQAAIFTGNAELCQGMGLRAEKQYRFLNGTIDSRLFIYPISERAPEEKALPSQKKVDVMEDLPVLSDSAQMFANRLRKNKRQLARWAKRNSIECYRIYDADIPEYAVAVDIYGEFIHVQEYAPPKDFDSIKAFHRLNDVMQAIPQVMECRKDRVILKERKRQQGKEQYQKQAQTKRFFEVTEEGCRLRVNLNDYLDTGLFLDHRPIRRWIQQNSKDKRVLNLFCYTGTATVHAAVGGAATTTSVDMSSTYLDWAKRNLSINGFSGSNHSFIQADCIKWLYGQRGPQFDLIFLDPPTFSNSKKMEGVLDIQRDQVELVKSAMALLKREGVLIFSNNYRRFKLDPQLEELFNVQNISHTTFDPDFNRNQKIHVCFRIEHK